MLCVWEKRARYFWVLLLSALLLAACRSGEQGPEGDPLLEEQAGTETAKNERELLRYEDLFGDFDPGSPIAEEAFLPVESAKEALHEFEGRLILHGEEEAGSIEVLQGSPEMAV